LRRGLNHCRERVAVRIFSLVKPGKAVGNGTQPSKPTGLIGTIGVDIIRGDFSQKIGREGKASRIKIRAR